MLMVVATLFLSGKPKPRQKPCIGIVTCVMFRGWDDSVMVYIEYKGREIIIKDLMYEIPSLRDHFRFDCNLLKNDTTAF